jgi:hypothetical protein
VLAETATNFADGIGGDGAVFEAATVDPLLDGDVRFGFELQIARLGVVAVVAVQGALDMSPMSRGSISETASWRSAAAIVSGLMSVSLKSLYIMLLHIIGSPYKSASGTRL